MHEQHREDVELSHCKLDEHLEMRAVWAGGISYEVKTLVVSKPMEHTERTSSSRLASERSSRSPRHRRRATRSPRDGAIHVLEVAHQQVEQAGEEQELMAELLLLDPARLRASAQRQG